MTVSLTFHLTKKQRRQIALLLDACRKDSPFLSLTFPVEGADFYLLLLEDGAACCAAAFTETGPSLRECSAFTAPAYRNRGYFSLLLRAAAEIYPEDTEFVFVADGQDMDAARALSALGAEFWYGEHLMELSVPDLSRKTCREGRKMESSSHAGQRSAACGAEIIVSPSGEPEGRLYELALADMGEHGVCRVCDYPSFYYLYDFFIPGASRRRGFGRRLLLDVLADLARRGEKPVRLQVSGENLPALSLYKKTGFQIIETLSYYVY